MSSPDAKNQQKIVDEVLNLLSQLELNYFSDQELSLPSQNDILNPIVQKLNSMVHFLKSQAQSLLEETQSIAKIGSWSLDLNTSALQWSKETFKIFEILPTLPQEIFYQAYRNKVYPDDLSRVDQAIAHAKESKSGFKIDYRILLDGGRTKHLELIGSIFQDQNGNPTRLTGTCQDISERKRAEEAIRKGEALHSFVFDQTAECCTLLEVLENKELRLIRYNRAYFDGLRALGVPGDLIKGLVGKNRHDALQELQIPQAAIDEEDLYFNRAIDTGIIQRRENVVSVPDLTGKTMFAETSFIPLLNDEGKCIYILYTVRDITERKANERDAQDRLLDKLARESAEKSNRLKDKFIATLSHELRTPLTSILAWIQMLRTGKLDAEKTKHGLEVIERSANDHGQLIDDLLDISRIQAGKLNLIIQEIDPNQIIYSAIEATRSLTLNKSIQIVTHLDSSIKHLFADPIRLQQIMWNLIINAIKFSPSNSKIEIKTKRLKAETGEQICIQVSDNGKGLKPEFLQVIFQRFTQVDSTTTRATGGLGLGLAIVKQLVEMHKGSIQAFSDGEDKGTTFTIFLPLNLEPNTVSKTEVASNHDVNTLLKGLKILLVEDDPNTREAFTLTLESFGAQIQAAASTEEGLEVIERFKPDILVSDIAMPGEDGYSLIQKVRTLNSDLSKIPAIALSACAGADDIRRVRLAGFQDHVAKPADSKKLALTIAHLAGRK